MNAHWAPSSFVHVIGLTVLAWMAGAGLVKHSGKIARFGRNVVPFVGLVYVIAFPFVGVAVLAWMGARTLMKR